MGGIGTIHQALKLIGCEIGVSEWFLIDQPRIDQFAEVTDDHQFIHVNPDLAANSAFGGTIAHGFLTLSLLAPMRYDCCEIAGLSHSINYGFDRVRFISPVRSGSKVRGRFVQTSLTEKKPGVWEQRIATTVEIEDHGSPALVAEWILQHIE